PGSATEEAAFERGRVGLGSGRVKADRFRELTGALTAHPWLAFCWLTLAPRGPVLDAAGRLLLETVKGPDDARRWPWSGRMNAFAEACCALSDRRVALELLTTALELHQRPELRDSLVRV